MLKTVSLQIVLVIVVAALGSLYWGTPGARDILLGGLACAVPMCCLPVCLHGQDDSRRRHSLRPSCWGSSSSLP